jgi:hypothetical protein
MLDRMHELEKRGDEKGKREACQVAAMAAPYARAASHCLAAADGAGLTDALLAREAAGSAAAPGRRPGSSREMQFCRTFGRNHLLRSVL